MTSAIRIDQIKRSFPWIIPLFKKLGLQIALALSYTISPRHTDEYYAQKTRDILRFEPDPIYLKDQGGLLTVDRARTLLPVICRTPTGCRWNCTRTARRVWPSWSIWRRSNLGVRTVAHGRPAAGQRLVAAVGAQRGQQCPPEGSFNQHR